jgi:hypothetical protein
VKFVIGLCAAALALNLVACDTKKKLDKMSSTTEAMGKTTEDMSKSTDEMNKSTKGLEKTSSNIDGKTQLLLTGMREAESVQIQTEQLKTVLTNSDPGLKMNAALVYFAAMEFQHWYPQFESETKRELLFMKAVDLFFSKIDPLVDDDMPISDDSPSGKWLALAAMSVGMSRIHPEQIADAEENGYVAMSFYDVLKSGLSAKADYLAGKKIPEYKQRILENERTIMYILQLRHNFFKGLILGRISKFEEGRWERIKMVLFGWDADLDEIPDAELKLLNEWLWKSMETQHYLKDIEEPVVQSESFAKVWRAGHIYFTDSKNGPPLRLETAGQLVSLEEVRAEPAAQMFSILVPAVLGESGPAMRLKP